MFPWGQRRARAQSCDRADGVVQVPSGETSSWTSREPGDSRPREPLTTWTSNSAAISTAQCDDHCQFALRVCVNQPGLSGCTLPSALDGLRLRDSPPNVTLSRPAGLQGAVCTDKVNAAVAVKALPNDLGGPRALPSSTKPSLHPPTDLWHSASWETTSTHVGFPLW